MSSVPFSMEQACGNLSLHSESALLMLTYLAENNFFYTKVYQ